MPAKRVTAVSKHGGRNAEQPESFASLCSRVYLGLSRERILAIVAGPSGVSRHALTAAYRGRRVSPETAAYLATWAREVHGAELDVRALVTAPTNPPRVVDGDRLARVIDRVASRWPMPSGTRCQVTYCAMDPAPWSVSTAKHGTVGTSIVTGRGRRLNAAFADMHRQLASMESSA